MSTKFTYRVCWSCADSDYVCTSGEHNGKPKSNGHGVKTYVMLKRGDKIFFEIDSIGNLYIGELGILFPSEYAALSEEEASSYAHYRILTGLSEDGGWLSPFPLTGYPIERYEDSPRYTLTTTTDLDENGELVNHYSADFVIGNTYYTDMCMHGWGILGDYNAGVYYTVVPYDTILTSKNVNELMRNGTKIFFGWYRIAVNTDGTITGVAFVPDRPRIVHRGSGTVMVDGREVDIEGQLVIDNLTAGYFASKSCSVYEIHNRWYSKPDGNGNRYLDDSAYDLIPDQTYPEAYYVCNTPVFNGSIALYGYDPYEVTTPSYSNLSKEYDCEGWAFETQYNECTAGDDTLVPVTITYSPSETSKDVGDYTITVSFALEEEDKAEGYYLDTDSKTFVASITPKELTPTCPSCLENEGIAMMEKGDSECVWAKKTYDGTPLDCGMFGSLSGILCGDDVTLDVTVSGAVPIYGENNDLIGYSTPDKDVGTYSVSISYTLSGSDAGNYKLSDDSSCSGTLKITPKILNVTMTCSNALIEGEPEGSCDGLGCLIASRSYNCDPLCAGVPWSVTGFIDGDDVSVFASVSGDFSAVTSNGEVVRVCTTSGDVKIYCGVASLTLTGSDAGNYEFPDQEEDENGGGVVMG